MTEEEISVSIEEQIAWVTIARPSKLNAIHQVMARELLNIAEMLSLNPKVKVVVLSGGGDRAFSVGSDIGQLPATAPEDSYRVRRLRPFPYSSFGTRVAQPVVAMIHGYCLGGGMELALQSDMRVASDDATFRDAEIKWGWLGGGGATQLLPRLIGYGHAMEMLTTGESIDASTALSWGLVDRVVPSADLRSTVETLATKIATRSSLVTQAAKRAVWQSMDCGLAAGLSAELELVWATFTSAERSAGIAKFQSRKDP